MAVFPALSAKPVLPVKQAYVDGTIRTQTDSGYVITRAKFARQRRQFDVSYRAMSAADQQLLETFATTTVQLGAGSFTWTHPGSGQTYTVRFSKPPEFSTALANGAVAYDCTFQLEEV